MIAETRELKDLISQHQQDLQQRIDKRGDTWAVHGREYLDYIEDFFRVINSNEIYQTLRPKPEPVVIDFMAPTEAVASLFKSLPHLKKHGFAVGLDDDRNMFQKQRDEMLGVQQITGDLMDTKTWAKLRKSLNGKKADLILETGMAGWNFMPRDVNFYGLMLNRAWNLLSENGGILLAEIPTSLTLAEAGVDMPSWRSNLDNAGVTYAYDNAFENGYLRINKTPNSPERLPLAA